MTPRLTIVHILGSLEIGGAEQVALNLAGAQQQLGHEVFVVSLAAGKHGPHAARFEAAGVQVRQIPKRGPSVDPSLPVRLAAFFRSVGAQVVHTHNPQTVIYGAPAVKLARVRLVHTKHGANTANARRSALRRYATRAADAVVAVSRQTAEQALAQGETRRSRLFVIENGIDTEAYSPSEELRASVRSELSLPADAQVVATVGRLSSVKNQSLLIRAMAPLLSQNVRLVIVGDGPEADALAQERNRLAHPEFVHLTGKRLDVPRLLPAFDIFALTSDSEGLPMVLPEAMASGLPVVSTAVGGIPDVVQEGVTGYLVPARDEVALRDALKRLLQDRTVAKQMGERARATATARYGFSQMQQGYAEVQRVVLGGAPC